VTRPANSQDWQNIDELEDSVACLRVLSAKARKCTGQWRNTTIPDFLATIEALLALAQEQTAQEWAAAET
jgi:hypothetical protein